MFQGFCYCPRFASVNAQTSCTPRICQYHKGYVLIHGCTIASLKLALISVRPDACKSVANTNKVLYTKFVHLPINLWQQHTIKGDISAHKICLLWHPVAAARRRPNQGRPDNEGHTDLQTACQSQNSSTTAADTMMMMINGE